MLIVVVYPQNVRLVNQVKNVPIVIGKNAVVMRLGMVNELVHPAILEQVALAAARKLAAPTSEAGVGTDR